MDYIYTVDLNSYLSSRELKTSEPCLCTLSNRNLLALASDCSLYILPLEKPNELIPVNLNNYPCIYLAWSEDGALLLNICKDGDCKLYRIKTSLLNTTEAVFNFRINKDDFICSKAFDKQSKLCLDYTKLDSVGYFAKFAHNSFNCLKELNQLSFKGFLLLTKRGKLHLCLTDLSCVKKQYESFDFDMELQTNNAMEVEQQAKEEVFFELGDFAYESDGSVLVAYTNKDMASSVQIYKVSIKFNADNSALEGSTELLTTLNLTTEANMIKSRVLFTSTHMPNTLCIQLTNEQTKQDTMQFWQVTKEMYNSPITSSLPWSLAHIMSCDAQLSSLTIPKSEINFRNNAGFESGQWDYKFFLLATYKDGRTGFINTSSFQQTFLSSMPEKNNTQHETSKKLRLSKNECFVTVDQSFTGLCGVGITNRYNLIAFRQPHFKELQSNSDQQFNIQNLVTLYEYSMLAGIDNWDLIISTNPKFMDSLVQQLELNFSTQPQASIKRAFFSRFYSLIYALSRRSISSSKHQTRSLDLLSRLLVNRSLSILAHSVQLSLNVDSLITTFASASSNYINTSQTVPMINTSLITTNMDYINSQTTPNSPANSFNHVPLKTNLNEYFGEVLKLDMSTNVNANELKSSEIIQSILNRKNTTVLVNHQLKHIGQWIIDMTLSLVNATVAASSGTDNDTFGSTLIKDQEFLNEVRKGLLFVKLLFSLNQPNYPMPVLPYRSMGYQKDLLNELFSIVTRLMHKANDKLAPVDDSLTEQCISVQSETISASLYKKFVNLRHSWFGLSTSSWLKTFQFPVDYLFDEERNGMLYPLFDIVRLIQFSRSVSTKQCIRCGNYTESGAPNNTTPTAGQVTKIQTSILIQDLCGNKCICGGAWVQSPIQ